MRLTRRATALAVVCTLIAAASAGCTSDDDGATADPTQVVIGADLASGTAVDTAYARALRLRLEQINASGTLGDVQLVLRIHDNGRLTELELNTPEERKQAYTEYFGIPAESLTEF